MSRNNVSAIILLITAFAPPSLRGAHQLTNDVATEDRRKPISYNIVMDNREIPTPR